MGCSRALRNRSAISVSLIRRLRPTILIIEPVYGVDRTVILDLASASETPETIRGGYCRAYLPFFQSCGLTFPISEPILEILAELGLSFNQICPNFLRHHVAFLVRAMEEGLFFGLGEFRHLVLVDRASMGDFDFSRLPRNWARNIVHSGSSLMLDEIRGLIGGSPPERRNKQGPTGYWQLLGSHCDSFHPSSVFRPIDQAACEEIVVSYFRVDVEEQTSDRPPLISIRDSDDEDAPEERRSPVSLSPGSEDKTIAATRKRRQSSKAALPGPSRCRRESTIPGPVFEGDGPLFAAQDDLISLPGRMRSVGFRLPSLTSLTEKEAYAKVAVMSSKVMEAFNEYVVAMEDCVEVSQNDKEIESTGSEIKRLSAELEESATLAAQVVAQKAKIAALEVERDRDIRRASRIARRDDGGLTVDAELARLKEMEKDCEGLVTLAAVSDWLLFSAIFDHEDMASRRTTLRDSERIRNRTVCVSAECIRSGDLSEALTEVLREETRLPRASPQEGNDLEGKKSAARIKSSSPTGSEGHDRPPKKAKTNGSDYRLGVSGDTVVAEPFHWQFSHSKDCPITEDPDSVAHLLRYFKHAGCPLPSLRNMTEHKLK
ncbi:hypothetical protein F2Q69_00035376 [Brassica cretica]|uniref:Uncharacterized protein n=1 Tax=Brassica cretica TaxID=69181 RepID=A0A8S9SJL8_BRACR|nr:hypothetical protein F2Q69_00035376 [Brassica cretica]